MQTRLTACLSLALTSCAFVMSFDYESEDRRFGVGGTVEGLEAGNVTLTLNNVERIEVGNGPFHFTSAMLDGAGYGVTAESQTHACAVERGTGTIATSDADVVVRCLSTNAALSDLKLTGGTLEPAFESAREQYRAVVPIVQFLTSSVSTTVTATAASPNAWIKVQGNPATSGQPVPVTLGSGDVVSIDVEVTSASGASRHYVAEAPLQSTYIKASNTRPNANFGYALAADGDTLVASAIFENSAATGVNGNQDDTSMVSAGAVYVFRHTAGGWTQEAYLKASNTAMGAQFGLSVAIQGDTLVVGAAREASGVVGNPSDTSAEAAGAVYVFHRSGTTWSQEAYVKAKFPRKDSYFGWSVALAGDMLVVGAPGESSSSTGIGGDPNDTSAPNAGAVYVFQRSGAVWSETAYLKASNTNAVAPGAFGSRVVVSGDTLAVSAITEASHAVGINGDQSDVSIPNAGAVYVFRKTATTWGQEAYVKASNTKKGVGYFDAAQFGQTLALDGDTLVVGAPKESSGVNGDQTSTSAPYAGAAYVFRRTGQTWAQEAYLKAANPYRGSYFGGSLALLGDTLAIGAFSESSAATGINGDQTSVAAPYAGAAYIFRRAGTTWSQRVYVKASNARSSSGFGRSIVLTDNLFAVGADNEAGEGKGISPDPTSVSAYGAGAVYVW